MSAPQWIEQRHEQLARAIAFLTARCILVSVVDRHATIRLYRISGKRGLRYAEGVIKFAEDLGHA